MQEGVGVVTTQNEYKVEALRAKAASRAGLSHSNSSLSELNNAAEGGVPDVFTSAFQDSTDDDGRIHIHQLKENERGGIA
ncbi:unnamed protein product, partial [Ectocarpus sp. 12 AP-2014]